MKKSVLISTLLLTLIYNKVNSQNNNTGVISGGAGVNIGATVPFLEVAGISGTYLGAFALTSVTTSFPIEANIGIAKPLSVGINYTPTNFTFPQAGVLTAKSKSLGVNFNLYPINAKRFTMQLAITPSKLWFNKFDISYKEHYFKAQLGGTSLNTRLIFNIFLSKNAGLYFNLGYQVHKMTLQNFESSFTSDDFEEDLTNVVKNNVGVNMNGVHAGIGVCFKLNNGVNTENKLK